MKKNNILIISFFLVFISPLNAQLAFPEAVGFAKNITGGRSGEVYHVTNLKDKGAGSLREGLKGNNTPRTIVFDVAGSIELEKPLQIKNNVTIAGQTAPSPGIVLFKNRINIEGRHNIIIRYLTVRCGDYAVGHGLGASGADGISIHNSEDIILDHLSISWSVDEALDISAGSKNVSVQHCIISEGLWHNKHKEPHSRTVLLRGQNTLSELENKTKGYTFYGNLFAHSNQRMPVVGGDQHPCQIPGKDRCDGTPFDQIKGLNIDFVNNVLYNWGKNSGHTATNAAVNMNYENNYLIAGQNSNTTNIMIVEEDDEGKYDRIKHFGHREGINVDDINRFFLYQKGNYIDVDKQNSHNGILVGDFSGGTGAPANNYFQHFEDFEKLTEPHSFPSINLRTAPEAYSHVLNEVGASLFRHTIDKRIINEVKERKGKIIDTQNEPGIGGKIDEMRAIIGEDRPDGYDSDRDGIPDSWENSKNLNPHDASDGNSKSLDGSYTNLEVFLNNISSSTLAVNELASNIGIVVYPNPTSNMIAIQSSQVRIKQIIIFNIQGKEVFSKEITTSEKEITIQPNLASGIYILKLDTAEKGLVSKKVIVK